MKRMEDNEEYAKNTQLYAMDSQLLQLWHEKYPNRQLKCEHCLDTGIGGRIVFGGGDLCGLIGPWIPKNSLFWMECDWCDKSADFDAFDKTENELAVEIWF